MLEQQQEKVIKATRDMYNRLQQVEAWPGDPLPKNNKGHPYVHDILKGLGLLEMNAKEKEEDDRFEEDFDILRRSMTRREREEEAMGMMAAAPPPLPTPQTMNEGFSRQPSAAPQVEGFNAVPEPFGPISQSQTPDFLPHGQQSVPGTPNMFQPPSLSPSYQFPPQPSPYQGAITQHPPVGKCLQQTALQHYPPNHHQPFLGYFPQAMALQQSLLNSSQPNPFQNGPIYGGIRPPTPNPTLPIMPMNEEFPEQTQMFWAR